MSVQDQLDYERRLEMARIARRKEENARNLARAETIRYMREALRQHKSWPEIGDALGVTDTGARRYFQRNHVTVP